MNFHHFWLQVRDLTLASLKSRYRKTFAGFLWVILNPLMMFGVQSLVFKRFMNIQVSNYYLFLLGGLLPWIFITSTIQMATPSMVTNATLLKSFKINPLVILTSLILDNFINFLFSFAFILVPFFIIYEKDPTILLLMPLAFVPLLLGTVFLSLFFSTMNVFFRDTSFVMNFIFSIVFFLTPIFYPRAQVPPEWQWLVTVNPIYHLISPFREIISAPSSEMFFVMLAKGLAVCLIITFVAIFVWKRNRNELYRKL